MSPAGLAGRARTPASCDRFAFSALVWGERAIARRPREGFVERLLLGLLEVWVGAGGVVGDVDDAVDLGHGLGDRYFDALAEGDRGHAAALASAAEA